MPHIPLPESLPGIRSLVAYRPDTGRILYELAEALLGTESSLPRAQRDLNAASVSAGNECLFCTSSHAAAARHLYGEEAPLFDAVLADAAAAPVDDKLRSLLDIAAMVRVSGRDVTTA